MWHHKVGETDQEPEPAPVADAAPGQPPGAAAQRRDQAAPWARPPFHTGCRDRRAKLSLAQWLAKAAGTTADDPSADVDDPLGMLTHLDDLRVKQAWRGHQAWFGFVASFPPPPATIPHPSTWSNARV